MEVALELNRPIANSSKTPHSALARVLGPREETRHRPGGLARLMSSKSRAYFAFNPSMSVEVERIRHVQRQLPLHR
jgi:hypothetical protein